VRRKLIQVMRRRIFVRVALRILGVLGPLVKSISIERVQAAMSI